MHLCFNNLEVAGALPAFPEWECPKRPSEVDVLIAEIPDKVT